MQWFHRRKPEISCYSGLSQQKPVTIHKLLWSVIPAWSAEMLLPLSGSCTISISCVVQLGFQTFSISADFSWIPQLQDFSSWLRVTSASSAKNDHTVSHTCTANLEVEFSCGALYFLNCLLLCVHRLQFDSSGAELILQGPSCPLCWVLSCGRVQL